MKQPQELVVKNPFNTKTGTFSRQKKHNNFFVASFFDKKESEGRASTLSYKLECNIFLLLEGKDKIKRMEYLV